MKISRILPVISLLAVFAAFSDAKGNSLMPLNLGAPGCPGECKDALAHINCNSDQECQALSEKFTTENKNCNGCAFKFNINLQ